MTANIVSTATGPATRPCGCGGVVDDSHDSTCCGSRDLPADPFVDLRVAYGMLLGEEDFRVLMANPRGKMQLHSSWLHGCGVVWGMRVRPAADQIQVLPGLAIDGLGRELRLDDGGWCVTTADWAQEWARDHPGTKDEGDDGDDHDGCATRTLEAWVVAEFACCFDRAVPTLADPCDVTRTQSGPSRIVETVRITTVAERPRCGTRYPRLRMLLGLDPVCDDESGREVQHALDAVADCAGDDRASVLLHWFRRLAACDEMDLEPRSCEGDCTRPWTPVTEECAPVVLAHLVVRVREQPGGCLEVLDVDVDNLVRRALLPTATIQDLLCGLAPGVLGVGSAADAGGPRLVPDSLEWTADSTRLSFRVTRPLVPGSTEGAIAVSSLSDEGLGWATEEVERVRVGADGTSVRVYLDARPKYETVRVIIRGTGPRTLFGADPHVPFAGVVGGPPGTADDGHDAVVMQHLGDAAGEQARRSTS